MFKESLKQPIYLLLVPLFIGYTVLMLGYNLKSYINYPIGWVSTIITSLIFVAIQTLSLFLYFTNLSKKYNDIVSVLYLNKIYSLLNRSTYEMSKK